MNALDIKCRLLCELATYFLSRKYGLGCPYPDIYARFNAALILDSSCPIPDCIRCFADDVDTTTTDSNPPDVLRDCNISIVLQTTDPVCANLTFRQL